MTEMKFKALAPVLKGKDKGKLKWFEGVLIGDGAVYIGTKNMGIQLLKDVKALCRYTGRTDKHNKEIYEGDIIKTVDHFTSTERYGIVKWDTEWAQFFIEKMPWDDDDRVWYDEMGPRFTWDKLEIVGNIYDNPELLEVRE